MVIKLVNKEDIKLYIKDFKYHIVYYFDKLIFGEKLETELDTENINEAFFFNENRCLHIYREDGLTGILYEYEKSEKIEEKQIAKSGKVFKSLESLVVNKIINFDEDGQAYIERVLPAKLIFN